MVGCTNLSSEDKKVANEKEAVSKPGMEENAPQQIVFAKDDVVNEFIIKYNELSNADFTSIRQGNILTKYFAYSNGYYCELLHSNATNKIAVSISQTNDNANYGVVGMRDVFHDVAKTIDFTLSDEEIYSCFDRLVKEGYLKDNVQLGQMTILFVPDKELSRGNSRGHIEIEAQ